MEVKITHLEEFLVAGISVRTINNGQAGLDIKHLWDKFFAENILGKIPNKINDAIYCVYTDYENDYTGYYTCLLGCKVSIADNLPKGLIYCNVPAGRYKLYLSTGPLPQSVLATWQQIWDSNTERSYSADFDLYEGDCWNGSGVKTYLGI